MIHAVVLAVVLVPCAPEAPLEGHALALSANPNEASLRYQWRGALHGMAGATIPIIESAETPWVFVFSPALEISNGPTSAAPVPFEYWRGRASLEFGRRIDLEDWPDRFSLRFSLVVTHESAHRTDVPQVLVLGGAGGLGSSARGQAAELLSHQVHTNDVGLRLFATMTRGTTLFAAALTQRIHFASCTLLARYCDDVRLASGLETELDLMVEGFALTLDDWLRPYAALSAMVIPAIDDMGREGRVVIEAGATLDPGRLGRFRVYFTFLAGHEPGFLRERAVVHFGVGIGFGFF